MRQYFGEDREPGQAIHIQKEETERKDEDAGEPSGPAIYQKELHLDKDTKGKNSSKKALDFKIQYAPSYLGESLFNNSPRAEGSQEREPQVWCLPFSVNDLDDFQTETDEIGQESRLSGVEGCEE